MERHILHIDMDAFFASVEQVLNPALVGKPLIVGGLKSDRRGVVSTASYEARKYGVHSAMPLIEAKRRCPHGIFIRGRFEHYRRASEQIRAILGRVSPCVEMASIDEAYVDITGSQRLFGGDDAIARYLKAAIRAETRLPSTIAIAPNKLVAKIASGEGKPDGYLRIHAERVPSFLRPLPLAKLPGAGPRTREILERLGIMTVGSLADVPVNVLVQAFGSMGYALQRAARGESTAPVQPSSRPKSISRETTFEEDLRDWERIERIVAYLAERCAHALRENGMETRCVTLKVRHSDFSTYTFSKTLPESTCLERDIGKALDELLPKARQRRARLRLVGVALTSLGYDQHQLRLFDGKEPEKWQRVMESVDRIRARHGFEFIRFGKSMELGRHVELATPSLSR